jgi:hypothetical protein
MGRPGTSPRPFGHGRRSGLTRPLPGTRRGLAVPVPASRSADDGKRQHCEASSKEKLAARLEKVTERLAADAPNMKRPGADLIKYYLDPDRHPVDERWSRKHAHTQRRLCERFAAPVIDDGRARPETPS